MFLPLAEMIVRTILNSMMRGPACTRSISTALCLPMTQLTYSAILILDYRNRFQRKFDQAFDAIWMNRSFKTTL